MHSSSIGGGGGGGGGFGFGGLLGFAVVSDTDRRGDARSRGFERVREEENKTEALLNHERHQSLCHFSLCVLCLSFG